MKRWISVLAPTAFASALALGCGPSRPAEAPSELQAARSAYARAELGEDIDENRAGLIEAKQALDAAEQSYKDSGDSEKTRALAYSAEKKVEVAESDARTNAELSEDAAAAESALGRSERRANAALGRLGLAAKEDERGTVISIPGARMFAIGSAEIKPEAQKRLAEIAKAVKLVIKQKAPQDVGRKMQLVGYTDSTGDEDHNIELSMKRAQAVRDFFAKHGLDRVEMQIEGKGEANPIADNSTEPGRAKNRRVEIVITPQKAG